MADTAQPWQEPALVSQAGLAASHPQPDFLGYVLGVFAVPYDAQGDVVDNALVPFYEIREGVVMVRASHPL
jgi:hypothetical protein